MEAFLLFKYNAYLFEFLLFTFDFKLCYVSDLQEELAVAKAL